VILYAESSAVLAWLLGEHGSERVRGLLAAAEEVVASDLTRLEVTRVLSRAAATGLLSPETAEAVRRRFERASAGWTWWGLLPGVLERAGRPFPVEPVRALDAVHLATALELRLDVGEPTVASLDRRVRANADRLGLAVVPGGA